MNGPELLSFVMRAKNRKLILALLEKGPKIPAQIMKETGMKRSTIFYKLKESARNSFINTSEGKYFLNDKIWPKVKDFLIELKKYEESADIRVPPGAVIHYKNEKEIVFPKETQDKLWKLLKKQVDKKAKENKK